eukprot:TRINITY_DN3802_c1_g2_i1.p1 TRINITY_DN3802_c1_g2~~TRINITY_DN3802_c1_g2_i1.p1  ORF type:complete len:357 (+),score=123.56 TRINITY_DN3802_c1_g2_i1:158-1228(+)
MALRGSLPALSWAHQGRWGVRASEQMSSFESMKMPTPDFATHWRLKNPLSKGSWMGWAPTHSWVMPQGYRGKGIEYRKFYGEKQIITPPHMGGPQEAVHDENRNRVFHNEMVFPDFPERARHMHAYISTRRSSHYRINLFSKEALQRIAAAAFRLSERKLIWNPHVPHQPVEGPVGIPEAELEALRKQAFLAGIDFPEFPDVKPARQIDPWEEQADDFRVPPMDNDRLLDAEMWKDVHRNMKGMEAKVRAFKDNERKKIFAHAQARVTQSLKRARMEASYLQSQASRLQQKAKLDAKEKERKLKPWERARLAEMERQAETDVSEETETETVTELVRKEQTRAHREVFDHRPPGFKG